MPYIFNETLLSQIDGIRNHFTISNVARSGNLAVYYCGCRQSSIYFTVDSDNKGFTTTWIPQVGDSLNVDYITGVSYIGSVNMALLDYMQAYLGELETLLGWEDANYDSPIVETLEKYGVATEALATDSVKLHAIARVELWRAVLRAVSFKYNFSADGGNYLRSQIYPMVKQNFEDALLDALVYLPNYEMDTAELTTDENPYETIVENYTARF